MLTDPLSDFELRWPLKARATLASRQFDDFPTPTVDVAFHIFSDTDTPATAASAFGGYEREVRRALNLVFAYGLGKDQAGLVPANSMKIEDLSGGSISARWRMVQEWSADFAGRVRDDLRFQDSGDQREGGLEYITRVAKAAAAVTAVSALLASGGAFAGSLIIDYVSSDTEVSTAIPAQSCVTPEFLESVPASRLPRDVQLEVTCTIRMPGGGEQEVTVRVTTLP